MEVGAGWSRSSAALLDCLVQTPGEKAGAILLIVHGLPVGVDEQSGLMSEAQGVPDFGERGQRNVEKPAELPRRSPREPHAAGGVIKPPTCLGNRDLYTAHQFLGELRWLGIRPTPSYAGEPECNAIMERRIRTLKDECPYLHDFATLDAARRVIGAFIERYNEAWFSSGTATGPRPTSVRATHRGRLD